MHQFRPIPLSNLPSFPQDYEGPTDGLAILNSSWNHGDSSQASFWAFFCYFGCMFGVVLLLKIPRLAVQNSISSPDSRSRPPGLNSDVIYLGTPCRSCFLWWNVAFSEQQPRVMMPSYVIMFLSLETQPLFLQSCIPAEESCFSFVRSEFFNLSKHMRCEDGDDCVAVHCSLFSGWLFFLLLSDQPATLFPVTAGFCHAFFVIGVNLAWWNLSGWELCFHELSTCLWWSLRSLWRLCSRFSTRVCYNNIFIRAQVIRRCGGNCMHWKYTN